MTSDEGDQAQDTEGVAGEAALLLGKITSSIPDGEVRPPQEEMCRAVATAIDEGRHLVVQAGTGTGKSLAYLVPAIASGKKVIVSTATLALQKQLADKDLPSVVGAGVPEFTYAVLKGRGNYLCLQRADEVGGTAPSSSADDSALPGLADEPPNASKADDLDPARFADQLRLLLAWSSQTKTGDRADLAFEPHERVWRMVSVGPRECPGAFRCPSGGRCFAERARQAASEADVVVVNTHLYGAHIASGGAVLPPHDIVIFDEAHEVEGIMTDTLGSEITPGRLRALVVTARPLLQAVDGATAVLDALSDAGDALQGVLEISLGKRVLIEGDRDAAALAAVLERIGAQVERVVAFLRRAERLAGQDGSDGTLLPDPDARTRGPSTDTVTRLTRTIVSAGHLSDDVAGFSSGTAELVAWVDGTTRNPVLRLSPVDVGPILAASLWTETTGILASATIPPRLADRLGLGSFATDTLDVGSPFDYKTQALLYVARHLPDRRSPEAEPALHKELAALINAAGGRTLALFTSRRATEAAAAAVRELVDVPILVQWDLPKARLLEDFSEDEATCLFATIGFWQGVDIPGRSLSLVTLDRLPFPRPDDPLLQARRTRAGDAAFRVVDLPRAATLLAQGAGRLIRRADDRGVVAVLDSRLATAGYRNVLLAALPPFRRTTDHRHVVEFLAGITDT